VVGKEGGEGGRGAEVEGGLMMMQHVAVSVIQHTVLFSIFLYTYLNNTPVTTLLPWPWWPLAAASVSASWP